VVQAGIKGGQPLPNENFSTIWVSTATIYEESLVLVKSDVSNNTEGATVTVRRTDVEETGVINVNQISTTSISGFNGVIDIPNMTNVFGLLTRTIENVSSIGGGITFSPDTRILDVLNMNISSINDAGPVTYQTKAGGRFASPIIPFSTFSTVAASIGGLDPTRLYNVTYSGQVPSITVPSVAANDVFFLSATSASGIQYANTALTTVISMARGNLSTFITWDSFSCRPTPASTITLGFGASTAFNAANVFTIDYNNIVVTNLGVAPV
jgi:hypothetical protein